MPDMQVFRRHRGLQTGFAFVNRRLRHRQNDRAIAGCRLWRCNQIEDFLRLSASQAPIFLRLALIALILFYRKFVWQNVTVHPDWHLSQLAAMPCTSEWSGARSRTESCCIFE